MCFINLRNKNRGGELEVKIWDIMQRERDPKRSREHEKIGK